MSENVDGTATDATDGGQAEVTETKDWQAEYKKLQENSRKWETRAKENSAAASRLAELEDAQKTETERLAQRAEAAEKRAAELEMRTLRAEVASAKGLSAAQARRLQGSTVEELEADADDLLEAFKAAEAPARPGNPDAGVRTATGPNFAGMSPAELQSATRRR